ncbi:MAG: radical SAM protein [Gemmatales bacterium]|nr:MAG: radical SAM protein [Gemmatales bacterium]
MATSGRQPLLVHRDHSRALGQQKYVYVVVSRRSKGVSVGINLNPDKVCNFDCIYCQVDRSTPGTVRQVDIPELIEELSASLDFVRTRAMFELERFRETPPELRRLNDIAFSGDGEPTTCPQFLEVVEAVAAVRRRLFQGQCSPKLVLITNATRFHHPRVQSALEVLDANDGEIWAKLDAGSEEYYRRIERTSIPFNLVLNNITAAAKRRPLIIQAMFMRIDGQGPPSAELEAFCQRLNDITLAGGAIRLVQVYTVSRRPTEAYVTPLHDTEIDDIVALVQQRTGLAAEPFYQ